MSIEFFKLNLLSLVYGCIVEGNKVVGRVLVRVLSYNELISPESYQGREAILESAAIMEGALGFDNL